MRCFLLVSAVSEKAEQVDEEVDEVEIEAQRSHQCHFLCRFSSVGSHQQHLLNLLRVVGRQANEDEYGDDAQDVVEAGALDEDVGNAGDDDSDESHQQDAAHLREVYLGGAAYQRHQTEGAGGDEEHLGNGCLCVDDEDGGECGSVEDAIDDEHHRGGGQRHLVDACRQPDDESQFCYAHDDDDGRIAIDGLQQCRRVSYAIGADAGDDECHGHPGVHFSHQYGHGGALFQFDFLVVGTTEGGVIPIVVVHKDKFF